jgi:acetyl esterase/lipase
MSNSAAPDRDPRTDLRLLRRAPRQEPGAPAIVYLHGKGPIRAR